MHYYMQILPVEEGLISYSVDSCSRHKGTVLTSNWYVLLAISLSVIFRSEVKFYIEGSS